MAIWGNEGSSGVDNLESDEEFIEDDIGEGEEYSYPNLDDDDDQIPEGSSTDQPEAVELIWEPPVSLQVLRRIYCNLASNHRIRLFWT